MNQAPVRVQVVVKRISCKNCGREYNVADLASLLVCESCGCEIKLGSIAFETFQRIEPRTANTGLIEREQASNAAYSSRISVKRYDIAPAPRDSRPGIVHPVPCVIEPGRATWVKVA
nr:hypothetical protein [Candidatus Sigynarchaeota archaeon]